MAGPRKSRGFTLVELLVVITIIGMLVSLLLPAIQAARETGRRNTCMSNMRNSAVALSQVHDAKRGFPGYANVVGNKRASWVVTILNQLDQGNVYQVWVNTPMTTPFATSPNITNMNTFTTSVPWAHTTLSILTCPSDPSTSTVPDQLSYVVNTGSAITANDSFPGGTIVPEDFNSGVFFNQAGSDANAAGPMQYNPADTGGGKFSLQTKYKTTMDFITSNDGTSYTLMLSENLQSGNWATDPTDAVVAHAVKDPYQSDFQMRQNTGFVWFVTAQVDNRDEATIGNSDYDPRGMKINVNARDIQPPNPYPAVYSSAAGVGGLAYARPSSAHTGGVNVIFCGGNHRFIAEEIPYHVYTQLMTPRQNGVVPFVKGTWLYLINEADY